MIPNIHLAMSILLGLPEKNRPRTESPGHNRPNKVGDYVRFLNQ